MVVRAVELSSWKRAPGAPTAGVAPGAAGLTVAARAVAPLDLTMVVAGLAVGLAPAATTAAAAAPATATGTAEPAGFAVGKLPPARTAVPGRLGLTVMRAVSFGGGVLTMEVPVLAFGSGTGIGAAEPGFRGTLVGGGGAITDAAGVPPGPMGLTGAMGAGPPGMMGLIGLTG